MNLDLKFLDSFKLSTTYVTNYACGKSENNDFFVLTDQGIYILTLRGDLSYSFPQFSCKKLFMPVSTYAACENIDIDVNSFSNYVERKDLYELALTSEYSVNLKHANKLDILPLKAEWSPQGLIDTTGCILAVLNSVYSLELYVRYVNKNEIVEYVTISNILEEVINEAKQKWESANRFSIEIKLRQFKNRIQFVSITGFTWGHKFKIGSIQHCTLFVGHMNGDITVWSVPEKLVSGQNWKPQILCRYATGLERIVTLHWHQTSEFGGGLCFADVSGRMKVVHITNLNKPVANVDNETIFWNEPDKVAIDKITVMEHDSYTFILAVKQRIILIFGLDKNGDVFGQKACYVDDVYITGLHHTGNTIYVLTLPGIFTELTLTVQDEKIKVTDKKISLKFDMKKYRTHGCFFSKNFAFFGLLCQQWAQDGSRVRAIEAEVIVFQNLEMKLIDSLWNNPSESLRDYWDCLEVLRITCIREKRFPWLGISPDLNYDKLSIYHLKLLRQLAKLSEMVFNFVPVVKNYDIKPFILTHYLLQIKLVVQRLKRLLAQKDLSVYQMRSIDVQNFFLKEMIAKNILAKSNVGKTFIDDIRSVMEVANEMRYPDTMQCIWCGENILFIAYTYNKKFIFLFQDSKIS
ncbi:unnamed protein product [Acanthoscelides obtectus]|uniref:Transcription factor IIIC 90kDa subunit N-terminal domain-containing protein n=1 Tax=Acanthoscelides obtectus TaxID=200917 RepID=A0A9P0MEJ1_ACAOB|nr:unnamed protein product [Acanthoscelides obtectus]CAK1652833.1 hypothetical protein AOBTE_LOCUS17928 [Acanthoscelides obtectus]